MHSVSSLPSLSSLASITLSLYYSSVIMLSIILCCAALFAVSNALPGGAPIQACNNLIPGNPPHGVVEQATPNPWIVDITGFDAVENSTTFTYNPGQTYTGKQLSH